MATATAKPISRQELTELCDAVRDDGLDIDVAASAADEPAPDYAELDSFVQAVGADRFASRGDWSRALGLSAGAMADAQKTNTLAAITKRVGGGDYATGIYLADVQSWIKSNHQLWQLTAIAAAMTNCSPEEVIHDDQLFDVASAVEKLGIDAERLTAALRAGEIRTSKDPNIWANTSRIEGSELRKWVEHNAVKLRPSLPVASICAHYRAIHSISAAAAPVEQPKVVTQAVATALAQRDAEAADIVEMRKTYAAILQRRHDPHEGDDMLLGEIIHGLKLTPEGIDADCAVLDEAERLEALAGEVQAAESELHAAVDAKKSLEKRHAEELDAAAKRVRVARSAHSDASSARQGLAALHERHCALFA